MKQEKFWSLVVFVPLLVGILWVLGGALTLLWGVSVFDDDFEAYDLGILAGQGGWTRTTPPYDWDFEVVDSPTAEGVRSIKTSETGATSSAESTKTGVPLTTGTVYFNIYCEDYASVIFYLQGAGADFLAFRFSDSGVDNVRVEFHNNCEFVEQEMNFDYDEWVQIGIQWNAVTGHSSYLVGDTWSDEVWCETFDQALDRVEIIGQSYDHPSYIDYISSSSGVPPPGEKIWGTDPASETEITDLETTFEFEWEGLDDWDDFLIVFQNRPTGIFSEAEVFTTETVGTSGTGEMSFSDFDFDRNGKYYFYGVASKLEAEILEGMYLTGGYSYEWTDDIVDPEYWVEINIDGFPSIFEMSDFETWYDEEVDRFATSTPMFVAISGFFEPIINTFSEFGNRIKDYFNINEAYAQGYEIGKSIAYFTFFVGQVGLFLGGFPILKWVFIVILLLVGIFIFRLIMKFIPGLG